MKTRPDSRARDDDGAHDGASVTRCVYMCVCVTSVGWGRQDRMHAEARKVGIPISAPGGRGPGRRGAQHNAHYLFFMLRIPSVPHTSKQTLNKHYRTTPVRDTVLQRRLDVQRWETDSARDRRPSAERTFDATRSKMLSPRAIGHLLCKSKPLIHHTNSRQHQRNKSSCACDRMAHELLVPPTTEQLSAIARVR